MTAEDRKSAPVGVFDSGVGGLTVVREITRQLPDEDIIYFGDTARLPYGNKSKENIIRFSEQIIRFLMTKNVKGIVVACNTASALALEAVRGEFDIPMIGVVYPGAKAALETGESRKIGVIGTEATVKSGIYKRIINKMDPDIEVIEKACPLFVPLVEEGFISHPAAGEIIDYYLRPVKEAGIDTMILGCTHYPLLKDRISEYLGEGVRIVNPAYETSVELKRLLAKCGGQDKKTRGRRRGSCRFYVSDAAEKFTVFANTVMPFNVFKANVVNIEEY